MSSGSGFAPPRGVSTPGCVESSAQLRGGGRSAQANDHETATESRVAVRRREPGGRGMRVTARLNERRSQNPFRRSGSESNRSLLPDGSPSDRRSGGAEDG